MQRKEWLGKIESIAVQAGPPTGKGEKYQRALLQLWMTSLEAPQDILNKYRSLNRDDLEPLIEAAKRKILGDDYAFDFDPGGDAAQIVASISTQIQALDRIAAELSQSGARVSDPNERWLITLTGAQHHLSGFLVPVPHATNSSKSFKKGALQLHRILPTESAGIPIKLFNQPGKFGDFDKAIFGAGLFPGLKLDLEQKNGGFTVKGVISPDQNKVVDETLASAHKDKCTALLFPELTICEQTREGIVDLLRRREKPELIEHTVLMIVPGSWHKEEEPGIIRNETIVLDGYGDRTLTHSKLLAYSDNAVGEEMIQPGSHVSVLCLEDALVAIGICLDFCEECEGKPYGDLDVDLFLIPSYGKASTMRGHIAAARSAQITRGARTFVVQQADPDDIPKGAKDPWDGYVLPPRKAPDSLTPKALRVAGNWVANHQK